MKKIAMILLLREVSSPPKTAAANAERAKGLSLAPPCTDNPLATQCK